MGTTTIPQEQVTRIEHLVQDATDSQLAYQTASKKAKSPELVTFFTASADQRAKYVSELQKASPVKLEVKPNEKGSPESKARRIWMSVREAINVQDDKVMLAEVAKAEKSTIGDYEKALKEGLPESIRSVVKNQLVEIQGNLKNVETRYEKQH